MTDPHTLWAVAQLIPGEGIEDGVARIAALLADSRDCRTCKHLSGTLRFECRDRGPTLCTSADRHDPLPPVKLWGKT